MLYGLHLFTAAPDNYLLFIPFIDVWTNVLILQGNLNLLLMAQILLSYKNIKALDLDNDSSHKKFIRKIRIETQKKGGKYLVVVFYGFKKAEVYLMRKF